MTLTDEARAQLERYLREVRAVPSGQLSVDVSDVERDIISHIDTELSGEPRPVGPERLNGVLERLGAPHRWVPVDDAPREQQRSKGPVARAQWRLPVLTLSLFMLGILSFMSMILWPAPLLLIAASVLVARAWLTTLGQQHEDIDARRWFVYPPLVVVYALMAAALIAWPLPFVAGAMTDNADMRASLVEWFHGRVGLAAPLLAMAAVGLWWVILGPVLYRCPRIVPVAFAPFGDSFHRRHALWLTLAGLLIAGASVAVLVRMSA